MPSRSIRDQRPYGIQPAGITPMHAIINPKNPATPTSQTAKPLQPSIQGMGGPAVLSNPTPWSIPAQNDPPSQIMSGADGS